MDSRDAEAAVKIVLVYLLESLEYLRDSSVRQMTNSPETNHTTQRQKKNLVHKETLSVKKTSLCISKSVGTFTMSSVTRLGLFRVVFPFNAAIFFPLILSALSTSWTVTGQSLIWLLRMIHFKSFQNG
jgi:hypothetical protein